MVRRSPSYAGHVWLCNEICRGVRIQRGQVAWLMKSSEVRRDQPRRGHFEKTGWHSADSISRSFVENLPRDEWATRSSRQIADGDVQCGREIKRARF